MLRIRQEQWDRFAAASSERFEQALASSIAKSRPAAADRLGADGLDAAVSLGVQQALERGIEGERNIASFVTLGIELDPTFELQSPPWIHTLLGQGSRSWTERLQEALQRLDQDHGN